MIRVHAIVAAGGEGSRFGGETPKQLVRVRDRSLLDWSIHRLLGAAESIAVAIPGQLVGDSASVSIPFPPTAKTALSRFRWAKWS